MKTIAVLSAFILSAAAWSDGQAPVVFTGKGKNPIEVRDSSGKVTEVHESSEFHLNQIPADAVSREETYRAKQKELVVDASSQRAQEAAKAIEEEKTTEEKAAADEKAKADAAAKAQAAAKLEAAQHPMKIRGKTVRGTRYVENPVVEPTTPPPPRGPVLSASGDPKKTPPPPPAAEKTVDAPKAQ